MLEEDLKSVVQLLADANYLAEKHRWLPLSERLQEALVELVRLLPEFGELEIA